LWKFRSFFYASDFSLFATEDGGNLSSTSLLIIKILIDSVVFLGGIGVFILTGIWVIVWDLIEGVRLFVKEKTTVSSAVEEAAIAGTVEAIKTNAISAPAPAKPKKPVDGEKLLEVLTKLDNRIKALEESKVAELEKVVAKMAETQTELLGRLQ
jgi:hypothetical protein